MATTPLILEGTLSIGSTTSTLTDYSDAITSFKISATADPIDIPATLGGPKSQRKGPVLYELEISYLSNDTDVTAELFRVLWTAVSTTGTATAGQLAWSANLRDGATTTANPKWTGTMIVMGAEIGGDASDLSSGSGTFALTAAPTISNS